MRLFCVLNYPGWVVRRLSRPFLDYFSVVHEFRTFIDEFIKRTRDISLQTVEIAVIYPLIDCNGSSIYFGIFPHLFLKITRRS